MLNMTGLHDSESEEGEPVAVGTDTAACYGG